MRNSHLKSGNISLICTNIKIFQFFSRIKFRLFNISYIKMNTIYLSTFKSLRPIHNIFYFTTALRTTFYHQLRVCYGRGNKTQFHYLLTNVRQALKDWNINKRKIIKVITETHQEFTQFHYLASNGRPLVLLEKNVQLNLNLILKWENIKVNFKPHCTLAWT